MFTKSMVQLTLPRLDQAQGLGEKITMMVG
jgi:hypothetical protein